MFKIVKDTEKRLRDRCKVCEEPINEQDKKLALEMVDYLSLSQDEEYAQKHHIRSGVGLAAPQVGVEKRIFSVYVTNEDKVIKYALINPKIIRNSVKKVALRNGEGCLSVEKDHPGYVYRYDTIVIKSFDAIINDYVEIKATGYLSIVLQHEYDHLDGILYYDRINKDDPLKEIPNSYLI